MLKFTRKSLVDITTYQQRINYNGRILVDLELMQNRLDYNKAKRDTLQLLARNVMLIDSSNNLVDLSRNAVYTFLTGWLKIPASYFYVEGSDSFSLNSKDVLARVIEDCAVAEEFLTYYMGFTSLKSRCGRIESLISALYGTDLFTRGGKRLYSLAYTASEQQNLRFNYQNEDIISIPKDYYTTFTVEDGYFLAWGDAAQADLRAMYNLFIRDKKNAAIMDNTKDKYEGIARLMHQAQKTGELDNVDNVPSPKDIDTNDYFGEIESEPDDDGMINGQTPEEIQKWIDLGYPEQSDFDKRTFLHEREIYKVEILATTYGSRGGNSKRTQEFAARFRAFLETCPRYVEYKKRLGESFDLGLVTPIVGYFGYEQSALAGKHKGAKQDFINKGLNTPIQTATSQVIILTVNEILNRFYEMGYTPDDISIYIVRHDEPIFKISERLLNDMWVLKQAQEIVIDNWTPMEIKFSFGYQYKVVDEELTNKIHQVYDLYQDKIDVYKPDEFAEPYWPVKKQFILGVGAERITLPCEEGGIPSYKTVVAIYSSADNGVSDVHTLDYFLLDTIDQETIENEIKLYMKNAADFVFEKDFGGAIVYNSLMSTDGYFDGVYFRFKNNNNVHSDAAQVAAHIMAARYCQREKIPFSIREDSFNANIEMIKQAGTLGVFKQRE